MKKTIRNILVINCIICLLLTFSGCVFADYKQAEDLLNNGEYASAFEIFATLGDYKDSKAQARECQYVIANNLVENNQHEEALSIYEKLGSYKDSANKAQECQYAIATSYYENQQYQDALTIYAEIGEYKDSADLAKFCEREIGMTVNADYNFLAALEQSVLGRMSAANNTDYSILVNTELSYLEKFYNESFYDAQLQSLAKKYIDGLYIQKDSLNTEYVYQSQIEWQRGIVFRLEALAELYNNYDFLKNNHEFIGIYIAGVESEQELLAAYEAIENDIASQMDFEKLDLKYDGYAITFTLTNNTKYGYDTAFEFSFLDKNGVLIGTDITQIEKIKPGMSYTVEFYPPNLNCTFNYENYYANIVI